jgi:hypothetical protein
MARRYIFSLAKTGLSLAKDGSSAGCGPYPCPRSLPLPAPLLPAPAPSSFAQAFVAVFDERQEEIVDDLL